MSKKIKFSDNIWLTLNEFNGKFFVEVTKYDKLLKWKYENEEDAFLTFNLLAEVYEEKKGETKDEIQNLQSTITKN